MGGGGGSWVEGGKVTIPEIAVQKSRAMRREIQRINKFHSLHSLEYFSCLCCAESVRSSNLLISSTFGNQQLIVGGDVAFHLRGIHDLAAFNRCLKIDLLYFFGRNSGGM